jgi:hypothetical protein
LESATSSGSWVLTLTSVGPAEDAGGLVQFVTHGTLDITMTDSDGGADTVELSLAF